MKNKETILIVDNTGVPDASTLLKRRPTSRKKGSEWLPGRTNVWKEVLFKDFVFRMNRQYLLTIAVFALIEFMVFKLLYPFPDFFSDSYSYLFAAYAHLDANIWPIGYSKFLSVFHWITHSDKALICFQYFFLEVCTVYFFLTIQYFYQFRNSTKIILFLFLFVNPVFLYISNYVSSDALFIAISLIWASELIWIIHHPKYYQILSQGILLLLAFTIRYNAMIYPIVTIIAFILSQQKLTNKIAGVLIGPLLILLFIFHSRTAAYSLTGTHQFPILSGWQWANNALYIREFIPVDSSKLPSMQSKELDRIARDFYRSVPAEQRDLPNYVANYFIRQSQSPLKKYLNTHYRITNEYNQVVAWGKVSPVFAEYGKYLIKTYPIAFAKHYLLVNTRNYFFPPLEKLEVYNLGMDSVWPLAQFWFKLPSPVVRVFSKELQGTILILYPLAFGIVNLYFACTLLWFLWHEGWKKADKSFLYAGLTVTLLLVLNFSFSVFANIIVFRYQVFPMILLLSFSFVLLDQGKMERDTNGLPAG